MAAFSDRDRTDAQRICRVVWRYQLTYAADRMQAGDSLTLFAPTYEAEDAVAVILAEIRAAERARVTP